MRVRLSFLAPFQDGVTRMLVRSHHFQFHSPSAFDTQVIKGKQYVLFVLQSRLPQPVRGPWKINRDSKPVAIMVINRETRFIRLIFIIINW